MRNKRLCALAAAAAVLLCVMVYLRWFVLPDVGKAPGGRRARAGAKGVDLLELRRKINDAYRLRPDARFLSAVADVHRFLTGQPKRKVGAEFRDGLWHVSYGEYEVGAVPEFPDFPEFLELLEGWTRKLAEESGASFPAAAEDRPDVRAELDRFTAPHAISAARMVDALWNEGTRDAGLLKLGAKALGLLCLQCFKWVEVSDAVAARALAALALCRALTSEDVLREECLIAEAMEYRGHAVRLSDSLPERDPLRVFLRREFERLEEQAWSPDATDEARYRNLTRISWEHAESLHVERWRKAADDHFDFGRRPDAMLPVLRTSVVLGGFGSTVPSARLMLRVALRELEEGGRPLAVPPGAHGRPLAEIVSGFEPALDAAAAGLTGPFVDREILDGYYRGHFYSALYAMARHYIGILSSAGAARGLLRELGVPRGGPAADFSRWLEHLIEAKSGKGKIADLHADIKGVTSFGGRPIMRTFRALRPHLGATDRRRLVEVKDLASRLDTREDHLDEMTKLAGADLVDPEMWERLYRARMKLQGSWSRAGRARLARFTGERGKLRELLREPNVTPRICIYILHQMEKSGGFDRAFLQKEYDKQVALAPDDMTVVEDYAEYLERIGEYARAREVLSTWLTRHRSRRGGRTLYYVEATVALARMFRRERLYQNGLEAIEPVVGSWKFTALEEKALLLDRVGRVEEAFELARAAYERYPDREKAVALIVELCWRGGKYVEAADALRRHQHPIKGSEWKNTLGQRLVEVFGERPQDAGKAAEALLAAGLDPFKVTGLANRAAEEGSYPLAFEVQSRIRADGIYGLRLMLPAYVHLRKWKGKSAAQDWLRSRIPADQRMKNMLGLVAHTHGEYDILWELRPEKPEGIHADAVWLMRAVASAKAAPGADPHREAVERHYEKERAGDLRHAAGRYLLGMTDEKELMAAATRARKRLDAAYYLGLKAQLAGRYSEAAGWYRVAYEIGIPNAPEYHWAREQLIAWIKAEKSLDLLAAE